MMRVAVETMIIITTLDENITDGETFVYYFNIIVLYID